MADTTISQLTPGTPAGNNIVPYSTGTVTLGAPVSAMFTNTTYVGIGSVALSQKGNLQIRNGSGANNGDLIVGNMCRVGGNINQGSVDFNLYYDAANQVVRALNSNKFAGQLSFNAVDGIVDFKITSNQQTADSTITNLYNRMAIDSQGRVTKPFQPAFAAWNKTIQLLAANTVMQFNEPSTDPKRVFNQGGYYANNKFTAPVAGVYQFSVNILMNPITTSGGAYWGIALVCNGTESITFTYAAGRVLQQGLNLSATIKLAAADFVEVRSSTDGTINIDNSGTFSGHLVG